MKIEMTLDEFLEFHNNTHVSITVGSKIILNDIAYDVITVEESGLHFRYPHFSQLTIGITKHKPKSQQELAAEDAVKKAEIALKAAQDVLKQVKEK